MKLLMTAQLKYETTLVDHVRCGRILASSWSHDNQGDSDSEGTGVRRGGRHFATKVLPMLRPLPDIHVGFRPATAQEVHSRSYGLLKAPRNLHATGWEQRSG